MCNSNGKNLWSTIFIFRCSIWNYHAILHISTELRTTLHHQGHFPLGGIFHTEQHFLLFIIKTNWQRVGVKRQKKISFRAENSAKWKMALMVHCHPEFCGNMTQVIYIPAQGFPPFWLNWYWMSDSSRFQTTWDYKCLWWRNWTFLWSLELTLNNKICNVN